MVTIERLTEPTADARRLVDELEAELAAAYPPEQRHGFGIDALFAPDVRFFVAFLDGRAVGCCGVAFDDGYAELKRMYVRDTARGNGVADALLARVEATVRERGIGVLRLETGVRQAAALRFYERSGFARRDAFGTYVTLEPHAVATSVFMEKRVT